MEFTCQGAPKRKPQLEPKGTSINHGSSENRNKIARSIFYCHAKQSWNWIQKTMHSWQKLMQNDATIYAKLINKSSWRHQGVSGGFGKPKGLGRDRFGSHFRNQLRLKFGKIP
jgi:hypothetical protein